MKNYLVLIDKFDGFTAKYLDGLLSALVMQGSVDLFSLTKNEYHHSSVKNLSGKHSEYFVKTGNPNVYNEFFDFVLGSNYDRIIIPRAHFLEYLVLRLMSLNGDLVIPISIGFYGLNEITTNSMRKFVISKFLEFQNDNKVILHSNGWYLAALDLEQQDWFAPYSLEAVSDPIYDDSSAYGVLNSSDARDLLKIPHKFKVILFFGSMYFGKGIDILLEAFDLLPENFFLVIASSSATLNMNFNQERFQSQRILHLDSFIEESLVPTLFAAADLVCMPYRSSYSDGTSGVLVQSALARKPICVPNIGPFSSIVAKYLVGTTFEVENPNSLAEALLGYTSNPSVKFGWDRYLSEMTSWDEIANSYL